MFMLPIYFKIHFLDDAMFNDEFDILKPPILNISHTIERYSLVLRISRFFIYYKPVITGYHIPCFRWQPVTTDYPRATTGDRQSSSRTFCWCEAGVGVLV